MLLRYIGSGPYCYANSLAMGALQHPLVTDDRIAMTGILRQLAPTYEHLRTALAAHVNATRAYPPAEPGA